MLQRVQSLALGLGSLVLATVATASPVQLTASQFAAQTSGLSKVIETFEGFSQGTNSSPLILANGSFSASDIPAVFQSTIFCGSGNSTQCLIAQTIASARTFSALPADSTFWSTDFHAISAPDVFQVTVIGGGGTTVFTAPVSGGFFGFYDPLRITSIAFFNQGTSNGFGNYSFDNVTTAASAQVPEPASIALVGLALAGLVGARSRKRSPSAAVNEQA